MELKELENEFDENASDESDHVKTHKRTVSEQCKSMKKEWWICSICLELIVRAQICQPCQHIFCGRCLQQLAFTQPIRTACPMCRECIDDCLFNEEVDTQIRTSFPIEYCKLAEGFNVLLPLPGKSARSSLSVIQWIKHTVNNRANIARDRTDRVMWHFVSFIVMLIVFLCSLYLGHFVILGSRYMYDYIPYVPVLDEDIKLSNVPLIAIAFVSVVVLILR